MLHDSLSALSMDDEKERAAFYIIRALDRFKLEADPERALGFFVDARAVCSNLDKVISVCLSDFRRIRLNLSSCIEIHNLYKILIYIKFFERLLLEVKYLLYKFDLLALN